MRYAGFTKQERNFITLMRAWIIGFLGLAALFAAIPVILLNYINDIGKVFAEWHSPPITQGGELWRVHAVVLHLCLAFACLIAQGSALRNAAYARIVLVATLALAIGCGLMFYLDGPQFYYPVGAAAYCAVFLITLWFYSNSSKSRS